MLLIFICIGFVGCSSIDMSNHSPYIKVMDSYYTYDEDNVLIDIPKDYYIIRNHPYDIVETDNGFDVVVHYEEGD